MIDFFKRFRHLSIRNLLDIDDGRIARSRNLVSVKFDQVYYITRQESILQKLSKLFGRKVNTIHTIIRYEILSDSGSKYTVLIETNPNFNEKKFLENRIKVFCNCPDFMFRCAWTLNHYDSLYLNASTREILKLALATKPTKVVPSYLCKHVYACINDLIDNHRRYGLLIGK